MPSFDIQQQATAYHESKFGSKYADGAPPRPAAWSSIIVHYGITTHPTIEARIKRLADRKKK